MRIFSLFLLITLGLTYGLKAQVDVSTAVANPKTFIFDDEKHTVHGHIYNTLKEKSSCCGNDAIYLEVKFDNTGSVTSAKTLTGKNDCYKKSVIDIVKSVRWDATGVSGTKTIYFEVKPIVPCSGSPGENVYKAIPIVNGGAVAMNTQPKSTASDAIPTVEEVKEEVKDELMEEESDEDEAFAEEEDEPLIEEVEEIVEPIVEEAEEVIAESTEDFTGDSFLSDEGMEDTSDPAPVASKDDIKNRNGNTGKDVVKARNEPKSQPIVSNPNPTPAKAYTGPVKIPPQEKLEYVSKGERSPEKSHSETFVNVPGPDLTPPTYADGAAQFGLQLRKGLRKSGFCGLAQAALEIEISPSGQVISTRVLMANNDRVKEVVPGIISGLRFKPQSIGQNYRSIQQFKAEIVCEGESPKHNLADIPNYIKQ